MLQRGLHRVPDLEVDETLRELADGGWRVFVLPEGINDRATFFQGVRAVLPLDPPVESDDVWDALSDSLWEGLHGLSDARIAIFWRVSAMEREDAQSFETATSVLADVCTGLADPGATVGNPKDVLVLLK
jgi:hypothetical protein